MQEGAVQFPVHSIKALPRPAIVGGVIFAPVKWARLKEREMDAFRFLAIGLAIGSTAVANVAAAADKPPTQLYGKSILFGWQETRVQRDLEKTNFYTTTADSTLDVYLSQVGRVFSKSTYTYQNGHVAGGLEQVAGQSKKGRIITFSGSTMTVFMGFGKGVRRLIVSFNTNFKTCSGRLTYAKQPGAAMIIMTDNVDHTQQEISSATFAGETCTISDENVFGK